MWFQKAYAEMNPSTFLKEFMNEETCESESVQGSTERSGTEEFIRENMNLPTQAVTEKDLVQTEVKPSSSKKLKCKSQVEGCPNQEGTAEGGQGHGTTVDQIIIAPEVMAEILEHLDLRSLKKVRLVCKSWLREAQVHLGKVGIVYLDSSERFQLFKSIRQQELQGAVQPFHSIDVYQHYDEEDSCNLVAHQLSNLISPPLVLTRFSPGQLHLNLIIQLVVQYSSTLEYLSLLGDPYRAQWRMEIVPPLDPEQRFPKLRHLNIDIWGSDGDRSSICFPSVVAWIVGASPNLDIYEHISERCHFEMTGTDIVLPMDIKNVKTLVLDAYHLNTRVLEHLSSIPFCRLQNLKLEIKPKDDLLSKAIIVRAIVAKSTATLRVLDLSEIKHLDLVNFPICPNVQEFGLFSFPYRNDFLLDHFPTLQVLNVKSAEVEVLSDLWSDLTPLVTLKTLRAYAIEFREGGGDSSELFPKFFEKFPALERLRVEVPHLLRWCELKATNYPRFGTVLEGLKHLELSGENPPWFEATPDYSPIAVLKGLEKITMVESSKQVTLIPFEDMASLKLILFPWGDGLDMEKLLLVAGGVEKVKVVNCCAVRRLGFYSVQSKEALDIFFDSAPNAECGCKEMKKIPGWWSF